MSLCWKHLLSYKYNAGGNSTSIRKFHNGGKAVDYSRIWFSESALGARWGNRSIKQCFSENSFVRFASPFRPLLLFIVISISLSLSTLFFLFLLLYFLPMSVFFVSNSSSHFLPLLFPLFLSLLPPFSSSRPKPTCENRRAEIGILTNTTILTLGLCDVNEVEHL